jgi:hypothetical protein
VREHDRFPTLAYGGDARTLDGFLAVNVVDAPSTDGRPELTREVEMGVFGRQPQGPDFRH